MYLQYNCTNSTTIRSKNQLKDELDALFVKKQYYNNKPASCLIEGRTFQDNLVILEMDQLFNICRKRWRQVEEVVFTSGGCRSVNILETRKQIVDVLSFCRYAMKTCSGDAGLLREKLVKHVRSLQNTITSWSDLEEASLWKLGAKGVKDETLPIFHYFHLYMDTKWLLLSLNYICEVSTTENYIGLLKDLVVFSQVLYRKEGDSRDVLQVNAFICSCIKQSWLLLQLFSERLSDVNLNNHKRFWEVFNEILKDKDEEFSLWLLYNVATLEGYNIEGEFVGVHSTRIQENGSFMDQKLKSLNTKFVNITVDNNQKLLNCCKLINKLLEHWSIQSTRSEPYQILWEIFNKHINLGFGSSKINSAAEFVQTIDHILNITITTNSYEYFLHMLSKYLLKYPNQWPRIRGRIYSKLPSQKMNDFSDSGLYNISLLLLSLIHSISLAELSEKLLSLLSNLRNDRLNSPTLINIYMSLIILHVRQGYSVKDVSTQLTELVQQICMNREMFHLIRPYIDGFDAVLNASENYNLQQHVLIGSWVSKYLNCCQYSDLCYLLNVLVCSSKRVRNAGAWNDWENVLKEYVLPGLKTVAMKENAPLQVGELAALIDPNPTSEWVLTFTADPISPKVVCNFISTLLEDVAENFTMPEYHETAILHAWTRCCLLNCEDKERLTRNVMKIRPLCNLNIKIESTPNPLISFIVALGKVDLKLFNLRELCEQCFGRLDSWIVNPYLKSPQSEASVVFIYTCIALLFYHCASLLYQKNRSNCLLNRLINTFLLPNDILMGKSPHPHTLGAIQRTWHRFVQGVFTLDCTNDAYLERILRDMIVHYIPLLSSTNCPILKCMENQNLATLILEKLSGAFLSHTARTANGNTMKAIQIITLAVENSSSVDKIKLVLMSTLTPILEVIMFHVQKNTAINFIKFLSSHEKYLEFKECLDCSIITVTEKHLAFNANNYFQFINMLAKIIPNDLRAILHSIKKQIVEVERMRGVGYDNTLRQGFDKLERLLN